MNVSRPIHKIVFNALSALRLLIQLIFLVMAPQAFSAAFAGARSVLASLAGGLPIDLAGFVAALIVLCAYTIIFGRFFCGWVCAFGLLGDILYYISSAVLHLFHKPRHLLSEALEAKLRLLKYAILVIVLLSTVLGAGSLITAISPWTAFGRLVTFQPEQMGIGASIVLLVIAILMMVKERAFCEFLCPLGALFSLLPFARTGRMKRDMQTCTSCARCQRSCPVAIYPPDTSAHMGECIACERCIHVCPEQCVTNGGKRNTIALRSLRSIALAVLLLVLLWAVGSVNFLPTPQELFFLPAE